MAMKPIVKVFLDTNIILDLIQRRDGYVYAAQIMQKAEEGMYSLYTSTLSMVNIAYILRKFYRGERLYQLLNELKGVVGVISVSSDAYLRALQSKAVDFEDAVQLFSAVEEGMDCVVTRNVQDFIRDILPIYSPQEFLAID